MSTFSNQQQGFSFANILLFLIVGGFVMLLLFKIGPMYMENMTIQSILDGMKERFAIDNISPNESTVRNDLRKQLDINSIHRFNRGGDDKMNTSWEADVFKVELEYEPRVHIIGNLDVIAKFKNSTELPIR